MQDIQVKRNGSFYEVDLDGNNKCKMSIKNTEEIASEWGIESEQVVQIRAILKAAEDNKSSITLKKFREGYKDILKIIEPEQLICYMIDNPGYNLFHPKKLLEKIKKEKDI